MPSQPSQSGSTAGGLYTLHAISNPANFAQLYPVIVAAGRAFLCDWPEIGTYRFVCGYVSADGANGN